MGDAIVAETPEAHRSDSDTSPEKAYTLVRLMVELPAEPAAMVRVSGFAVMLKSGPGTVTNTDVPLNTDPLLPLTPTK